MKHAVALIAAVYFATQPKARLDATKSGDVICTAEEALKVADKFIAWLSR